MGKGGSKGGKDGGKGKGKGKGKGGSKGGKDGKGKGLKVEGKERHDFWQRGATYSARRWSRRPTRCNLTALWCAQEREEQEAQAQGPAEGH